MSACVGEKNNMERQEISIEIGFPFIHTRDAIVNTIWIVKSVPDIGDWLLAVEKFVSKLTAIPNRVHKQAWLAKKE
jgi:hypothetical protein